MPQRDLGLARACAELIRLWHAQYWIADRSKNIDDDQFRRYGDRVEHFYRVDLSDPAAQEEIAHEQRSRMFEWAYTTIVPMELWNELVRRYEVVDHRPPRHLGEAANWILESLDTADPTESREDGSRRIVQAETQARLFEHAQKFYADVIGEQVPGAGVGGINVLVSCSLERYPWKDRENGVATLLRPEALGLRLGRVHTNE